MNTVASTKTVALEYERRRRRELERAAAGLPTMARLSTLLLDKLPSDPALAADWGELATRISSMDLESALDGLDIDAAGRARTNPENLR